MMLKQSARWLGSSLVSGSRPHPETPALSAGWFIGGLQAAGIVAFMLSLLILEL